MEHAPILKNLAKHIVLNSEEQEYFLSLLKSEKVAKNDFVLRQGDLCKTINFVHQGTLRAFFTNQKNKESTIMFGIQDWWITDMHCFLQQSPAMLSIQAVEESSIFRLKKIDLETLYTKVPAFERFFRIIMQNAYVREQLRMMERLSLSAEERYYNFIRKYPQMVEHVTQKQIASYLGITPEFLSAIRAMKRP